jgi:hypothetical protein
MVYTQVNSAGFYTDCAKNIPFQNLLYPVRHTLPVYASGASVSLAQNPGLTNSCHSQILFQNYAPKLFVLNYF